MPKRKMIFFNTAEDNTKNIALIHIGKGKIKIKKTNNKK